MTCASTRGCCWSAGRAEYGFIHLTFEEYLAAVAIALHGQQGVQAGGGIPRGARGRSGLAEVGC